MSVASFAEKQARKQERTAQRRQEAIDRLIDEIEHEQDEQERAYIREELNQMYALRNNAIMLAAQYRSPAFIRQLESDDVDAANNAVL